LRLIRTTAAPLNVGGVVGVLRQEAQWFHVDPGVLRAVQRVCTVARRGSLVAVNGYNFKGVLPATNLARLGLPSEVMAIGADGYFRLVTPPYRHAGRAQTSVNKMAKR